MRIRVEYEVINIVGQDQIDQLIDSLRDIVKKIIAVHDLRPLRIEVEL